MKPGIYAGISNADYHADKESFSSSQVKLMDVPALARYSMDNPSEYKDCYRIGSAIHKVILEPDEFDKEFLIGISAARRSAADKLSWAEWFTEHGANGQDIVKNHKSAEWNPLFERQSGRHMVTPDEIKMIKAMAEAVKSNPKAIELFYGSVAEHSVYWQDDSTGLNLRCRPDIMSGDFLTDLKSTDSVKDISIQRAMTNMGYPISAAMYQQGVFQITNVWKPFIFLFVDKNPPHLVRVIALDQDAQRAAAEKYLRLLLRLKECLNSGIWPGIDDDLEFQLPAWAFQ